MGKREVNIHIGEFFASNEPAVIHTILGSCVAVCLYDPVAKVGGMNHILLPGRAHLKAFDMPARFGINAMELLINALMSEGADRRRIVAKVFGGARIIPGISREFRVGAKIISFILRFLKNERIRVVTRDLGGEQTRKIYFHTDTGTVFLKRLKIGKSYAEIALEERKKLEKIRKEAEREDNVTLF